MSGADDQDRTGMASLEGSPIANCCDFMRHITYDPSGFFEMAEPLRTQPKRSGRGISAG